MPNYNPRDLIANARAAENDTLASVISKLFIGSCGTLSYLIFDTILDSYLLYYSIRDLTRDLYNLYCNIPRKPGQRLSRGVGGQVRRHLRGEPLEPMTPWPAPVLESSLHLRKKTSP